MAQFPGIYNSRYGDSIAELLARQGEIAARGAEQKGALWANAISQLGQIGAGAVEAHQERKAQSKRDAALMEFVNSGSWVESPEAALRGSVAILGPSGVKFAEGLIGVAKLREARSPEDIQKTLPSVARGFLAAPDKIKAQLWQPLRGMLEQTGAVEKGSLPDFTPELVPMIQAYAGTEKAEGFSLSPGEIRYDPSGKQIAAAPPKPVEPKAPQTQNIAGRVMQFNPESGRFDIDLGASEAALGREAAEAARDAARSEAERVRGEKRVEKEKEAAEAARATDDQIRSAFGAMKSALGEVKRLSGAKALTSPLEAANARQQYDDAAKAFAATLSRATGDSRISDLDRKAYASLLTYQGIGSGALKIMRPDLVEERLTKAETIFADAAKERKNRPKEEAPAGAPKRGKGTSKDPYVFE